MTNEAVVIVETEIPINFTTSGGTTFEKGTTLQLVEEANVRASTGVAQEQVGGIAKTELINDGTTKMAVYRGGIFKVTTSGAVVVGDGGIFVETNMVRASSNFVTLSGSQIAGIFLETAADGDTALFELRPQVSSGGQKD